MLAPVLNGCKLLFVEILFITIPSDFIFYYHYYYFSQVSMLLKINLREKSLFLLICKITLVILVKNFNITMPGLCTESGER